MSELIVTPTTPVEELPELLTVDQLAAYLQMTRRSVWIRNCRGTGLPPVKFGQSVRYRKADLLAYLNAVA